MSQKKSYRNLVKDNVISIYDLDKEANLYNQRGLIPMLTWLSDRINSEKEGLKINTVDFIITKVLNRNGVPYSFENKNSFDVYVLGTFRKFFNPTNKVAEAFAEFYLEVGILPKIDAIPKHIFLKNSNRFVNKIRNGVLIYDKRGSLS